MFPFSYIFHSPFCGCCCLKDALFFFLFPSAVFSSSCFSVKWFCCGLFLVWHSDRKGSTRSWRNGSADSKVAGFILHPIEGGRAQMLLSMLGCGLLSRSWWLLDATSSAPSGAGAGFLASQGLLGLFITHGCRCHLVRVCVARGCEGTGFIWYRSLALKVNCLSIWAHFEVKYTSKSLQCACVLWRATISISKIDLRGESRVTCGVF